MTTKAEKRRDSYRRRHQKHRDMIRAREQNRRMADERGLGLGRDDGGDS